MAGTDDEWPIHPSDEWPIRPDPKPGDTRETDHANGQTQPLLPRIYVAPDETDPTASQPTTQRSKKSTYKIVFFGVVTLVFGFVFITDFFDGYQPELVGVSAVALLMGIIAILPDDDHDGTAYKKKKKKKKKKKEKALREAKRRHALISDDEQPVIPITKPIDGRISDDDVWPVLPQKGPEPSTPEG